MFVRYYTGCKDRKHARCEECWKNTVSYRHHGVRVVYRVRVVLVAAGAVFWSRAASPGVYGVSEYECCELWRMLVVVLLAGVQML